MVRDPVRRRIQRNVGRIKIIIHAIGVGMRNSEIVQVATQLIRIYGDGAAMEAAQMADKMQRRGDPVGANTWKLIMAAVRKRGRGNPSPTDIEEELPYLIQNGNIRPS